MKHNILYLSYDGLTDPLGQSQVLPYLIGLSHKGYSLTIISFEKQNNYKTKGSAIESLCSKNRIDWIPLKYRKQPPIVSTLFNVFELWQEVKKLFQKERFQIVHCRSYVTSLVGLQAKSKWGVKFIFDMRGFWADERAEGGLWNLKNPFYYLVYKYFKKQERKFLDKADAVVSLTNTSKEYLIKSFSIDSKKITVINCCVDTDLFNPENVSESTKMDLKTELGQTKETLVLLYLGSTGTWYMLKEMLVFFKALCQKHSDSQFLIITPDPPRPIQKTASETGIDLSKIIIRKAEREEVPLYISISNYSILLIKPVFSKQASFPTKLGEVLSMGLPVVANTAVGDNDYLFGSGNIGVLIQGFEQENFTEAVRKLVSFKETADLRSFAMNNFSLKKGVELYDRVYQTILL